MNQRDHNNDTRRQISRRSVLKYAGAITAGLAGASVIGEEVVGNTPIISAATNGSTRVYDVTASPYNADKTGAVNCGPAIQSAINQALADGGGSIYFPSGIYRVQQTLNFSSRLPIEILGNGQSSKILWDVAGDLFNWPLNVGAYRTTAANLQIVAARSNIPAPSAAFNSPGGMEQCFFSNLYITDDITNTAWRPGSGIRMVGTSLKDGIRDIFSAEVTIDNCFLAGIKGTGIRIGRGAEVRVMGGRIIGTRIVQTEGTANASAIETSGSLGIHLTGNNGGVHIVETDITGFQHGIRIENESPMNAGTNREIFLTHVTFDNSWRGLAVYDASIITVIGCWAGFCHRESIYLGLNSPILVVSGGYIYHCITASNIPFGAFGMTVDTGSFSLTGVTIFQNYHPTYNPNGKGVYVPGTSPTNFTITGCRITNNGQGLSLAGSSYIVANNVFAGNATANFFGGTGNIINNNIRQNGF
jgi:parallel beta-helix repeat protein